MIRYLDVVTDEMRRMRIARESRGFERPRRPALAACSRSRPARCSSAPTSAASGSTWRCCRRGYTGSLPVIRRAAGVRRAAGPGGRPPLLAALVVPGP